MFKHKSAIGVWTNDVRNTAFQTSHWPQMIWDEETENSLRQCIDKLSLWGYNQFCLWGLLNSYSWPVDFESGNAGSDPERLKKACGIIDYAHRQGLKIIYGLGIYSWGFQEIIRHNPAVRGSSDTAICGSQEASFELIASIIDFIFRSLNIDGLHFESADQGRCRCSLCAPIDDFAYHCGINSRVAAYVRQNWPDKIVMVNMISWQDWDKKITQSNAPEIHMLQELGKHVDYIIDPGHIGHYVDDSLIPSLVGSLPCEFGNAGGFWTYFWSSFDRLRVFWPYTQTAFTSLQKLYGLGGRAVEYYTGPVGNPGVEINTAFAGYVMNHVGASYREALDSVVSMVFQPKNDRAAQRIASVVERTEHAWFVHWTAKPPFSWKTDPNVAFNDFDTYRLDEKSHPSQIILDGAKHLTDYMDSAEWPAYQKELAEICSDLGGLTGQLGETEKLIKMQICFTRMMTDLDELMDFFKWY